jgi:hypothetical protein
MYGVRCPMIPPWKSPASGNITEAEVAELEGLFRHIYRKDTKANPLNEQRGFKKLKTVGKKKLVDW